MKIKYLTTYSTGTSISIVTGCDGIGLDWIYRLIVKFNSTYLVQGCLSMHISLSKNKHY